MNAQADARNHVSYFLTQSLVRLNAYITKPSMKTDVLFVYSALEHNLALTRALRMFLCLIRCLPDESSVREGLMVANLLIKKEDNTRYLRTLYVKESSRLLTLVGDFDFLAEVNEEELGTLLEDLDYIYQYYQATDNKAALYQSMYDQHGNSCVALLLFSCMRGVGKS